VTIRERRAWLNNSGFCRSAKDGNDKPDKEDKRDDGGEGFSPLFVVVALPVAALMRWTSTSLAHMADQLWNPSQRPNVTNETKS
jgi:hypothetical protein